MKQALPLMDPTYVQSTSHHNQHPIKPPTVLLIKKKLPPSQNIFPSFNNPSRDPRKNVPTIARSLYHKLPAKGSIGKVPVTTRDLCNETFLPVAPKVEGSVEVKKDIPNNSKILVPSIKASSKEAEDPKQNQPTADPRMKPKEPSHPVMDHGESSKISLSKDTEPKHSNRAIPMAKSRKDSILVSASKSQKRKIAKEGRVKRDTKAPTFVKPSVRKLSVSENVSSSKKAKLSSENKSSSVFVQPSSSETIKSCGYDYEDFRLVTCRLGVDIVCKICLKDFTDKEVFVTHFQTNHNNFIWSKHCSQCASTINDAKEFHEMLEHAWDHVEAFAKSIPAPVAQATNSNPLPQAALEDPPGSAPVDSQAGHETSSEAAAGDSQAGHETSSKTAAGDRFLKIKSKFAQKSEISDVNSRQQRLTRSAYKQQILEKRYQLRQ